MAINRHYIDRRANIADGKAIIRDTRVPVSTVARMYVQFGWSVEQISSAYRNLTLAQIHAALAYYYENQVELDAELTAKNEALDALRGQYSTQPTAKRGPLTYVWVFQGNRGQFA